MTSSPLVRRLRAAAWLSLALIASLLLLSFAQTSWASEKAAEPPPKKPGFWKRLATEGMTIEVGKDGIRTGPANETRTSPGQRGGRASTADIWAGDSDEAMHTRVRGGNRVPGIFSGDNVNQARKGLLEWPRVAVTFKEFGVHEPCWLVDARVWTSASKYTDETSRICTSPLTMSDDLGSTSRIKWQAVSALGMQLTERELHFAENSGGQRTKGPLPPLKPFGVNIAVKMQPGGLHAAENNLHTRYESILVRLAWVAGFVSVDDIDLTGMASSFDKRMWVAGFDPAGNKDKGL